MPEAELLVALRTATQRLVRTIDALGDAEWATPSLLPEWSRAHVVAHLALNAEGLAASLEGLVAGTPVPMYAGQAARDADIRRLVADAPGDLRERLLGSTTAVADALCDLPDHLARTAIERVPGGATFPAGAVANMRLREVEIHHADLGAAYTCADWPAPFAELLLDARAARATPDDGFVAEATDLQRRWVFGTVPADGPVVTGPLRALAWWSTGRPPGPNLTCDNGAMPGMETW